MAVLLRLLVLHRRRTIRVTTQRTYTLCANIKERNPSACPDKARAQSTDAPLAILRCRRKLLFGCFTCASHKLKINFSDDADESIFFTETSTKVQVQEKISMIWPKYSCGGRNLNVIALCISPWRSKFRWPCQIREHRHQTLKDGIPIAWTARLHRPWSWVSHVRRAFEAAPNAK